MDAIRPGISSIFKVVIGKDQTADVPADHADLASRIDTDNDKLLSDTEVRTFLKQERILKDPASGARVNEEKIVSDFKRTLQGQPLPQAAEYHSYDEMREALAHLAADHPDRAQLVSLGKSVEGRDVWALKISGKVTGDTSHKPGVMFTGCHHAREWMSMEVPLDLAHNFVEKYDTDPEMKRRVDNAEIWIAPMVNPDGYEYSRTRDAWWRKNRRPNTDTGCGNGSNRVGVDLNRNYDDGKPEHAHLYRPAGDTPCKTFDDFGVTSDFPGSDVYRGPRGLSEPETRAVVTHELGRPNMRGVIDHHGYGGMLLRPWGHTDDPPDKIADYDELGRRMRAAQDDPYRYMSSGDLYPTAGTSTDMLHANGKYAFTIELGDEFQPDPATFDKMNVENADLAFLDWILEKYPAK
ncbi:MAG: zinc carboxypeptidase [Armatimonadetes bacterium]|nr:zinc carboxypeptidase [Armatimonadota bacterium]